MTSCVMGGGRAWLLFGLVLATGCAERRTPPPVPVMRPGSVRADLRAIDLHLRTFHVTGGAISDPARVQDLAERFLDYLEAQTRLSDIYYSADGPVERPSLVLDAELALDQTTYRTYVLDLVA